MSACPECGGALTGIEVRGVYDGVLIWCCRGCGRVTPRFDDGYLHDRALDIIRTWGRP